MTASTEPSANALIIGRVARELSLSLSQVQRTLALFAEGATLPFIARYRKEVTGGLDEVQLRDVRERADYLHDLEDRRVTVLGSIEKQGKLDDALRALVLGADTRQSLEDLYRPFRPKRRTRAVIARERGLEPLAEMIWDGTLSDDAALRWAAKFVLPDTDGTPSAVPTVEAALQGARDILAERVADDAAVRGWVREMTRALGLVRSTVIQGKASDESRFRDYFDFSEALGSIPSHRMLAIRRGEKEGELLWRIEAPADEIVARLESEVIGGRKALEQLVLVAADGYKRILAPAIEIELRVELKTRADEEAISIFGRNLEQLLLAAPAGGKRVMGLDPGFRTGVKVAVVSATGALVHADTLYLQQEDRFTDAIRLLVTRVSPDFIAIGNGTASRETESLTRAALRELGFPCPQVVVVSEAGASVYSASDIARQEFPELDVSLRGAVSIARRLQDPLAELVKIDPKSIGVGQYQHDVNQTRLKKRLDDTVESCVNRVGVEVNTASASLLGYVAGIGPTLAQSIVTFRDSSGGFRSRHDLRSVSRLGAKAFEQAAGFLRVRGGAHPLDSSAVHPERYPLVERMADDLGVQVIELIGADSLIERIDLSQYAGDGVGIPTLRDIAAELRKPGRDPRAVFEAPAFSEDVQKPSDLLPGMRLEGVVTNIVAFGAFVDIGVHQDGLVHMSQLADRYVKDASDVIRVGQKVMVTVRNVDLARSRIALSMRSDGGIPGSVTSGTTVEGGSRRDVEQNRKGNGRRGSSPSASGTFVPSSGSIAPNGMRFK